MEPGTAEIVVTKTLDRFGRIDALVNIAGALAGLDVFQAGISRFGEAEEIADVMAFAASPAARWMTGTVLRTDGGEVRLVFSIRSAD
jgi:NAD(P)-dependent dehydrogenase (short-subunit alcohol dehydrogenase family)